MLIDSIICGRAAMVKNLFLLVKKKEKQYLIENYLKVQVSEALKCLYFVYLQINDKKFNTVRREGGTVVTLLA